jgi:hypothetical protein
MGAAHITDISKLRQQINAYKEFNSTSKGHINTADAYLFRMKEEIIRNRNILEHRLEDAKDNMNRCIIALSACETRVEYDDEGNRVTPNCNSEQRDLDDARREKQAAQNCVDEMNRCLRMLQEYEKRYEEAKSKFNNLLDNTNHQAIAKLETLDSIAQEYINSDFNE